MVKKKTPQNKGGEQKPKCSRCNRHVSPKTAKTCPTCGRHYHSRCYLADTGIEAGATRQCVCCLSTVLDGARMNTTQKQSKHAAAFLRDGFCIIPLSAPGGQREALTSKFDDWSEEVSTLFRAMIHAHECRSCGGGRAVSLDEGYSNFRQRGLGRFEMIHPSISDKVVNLVEQCEEVQQTLRVLLTGTQPPVKQKLMSSGCFFSVPGSESQQFHTDGPALSDAVDLFPYAINVFVPLVDIDRKNGTEFVPKSQLPTETERQKAVKPEVGRGYALLFDYRVVHRGLGNRTGDIRPCLYATYSRDWYTDRFNFSRKRYRGELQVSEEMTMTRAERLRRRTE